MLKQTINIYSCDACGKEIEENEINTINGIYLDEQPSGCLCGSDFEFSIHSMNRIDLCSDCKKKYDMIRAYFVNDMLNMFKANKEIIDGEFKDTPKSHEYR